LRRRTEEFVLIEIVPAELVAEAEASIVVARLFSSPAGIPESKGISQTVAACLTMREIEISRQANMTEFVGVLKGEEELLLSVLHGWQQHKKNDNRPNTNRKWWLKKFDAFTRFPIACTRRNKKN
jgi:hypothetical protein